MWKINQNMYKPEWELSLRSLMVPLSINQKKEKRWTLDLVRTSILFILRLDASQPVLKEEGMWSKEISMWGSWTSPCDLAKPTETEVERKTSSAGVWPMNEQMQNSVMSFPFLHCDVFHHCEVYKGEKEKPMSMLWAIG